jgi:hypothetical protein
MKCGQLQDLGSSRLQQRGLKGVSRNVQTKKYVSEREFEVGRYTPRGFVVTQAVGFKQGNGKQVKRKYSGSKDALEIRRCFERRKGG